MDLFGAFWDLIVHLDRHLGELTRDYGTWIYAIIFAIIFCETGLVVTPFLPGDSLLFVAGALWAAADRDVLPLAATIIVAAFCGDNLNYFFGRFLGQRLLNANTRLINRQALERTRTFYQKHGGKTVIIARFLPLIRTFAPFVAGIGRMSYARYIAFSIAASLLWVGLLVYAGYFFGNVPIVKNNFSLVVLGIIVVSLAPGVYHFLRARLRRA